eukprot:gnl/Spiro4/5462_TR2769_c0_g1_i2.p1 gnl/Spiro4/5462_TR2769_c0_g1~~gnl/Spiro4/5462_TR2769_c0_g1_i2.p1  ORF type:complete len:128 (+),score=24.18 gnl/Spiro4/5462_TR2769_c0_g1_i2:3201-3584(+)
MTVSVDAHLKNEHVSYEINMMIACFTAMRSMHAVPKAFDQFYFNVLHEAFCVHAHNLMSYFPEAIASNHDWGVYRRRIEDQIITLDPDKRRFTSKITWPKDHKAILDIVKSQMQETGATLPPILEGL